MDQALVVAQLLPELDHGGVERGTVEVANFLAENNCVSIVISAGGRLEKKLSPNVIHIKLDIGKKSVFVFNLIKPLRNILKQYRVNIVHARSRLPAWIAYKAISKIKLKKPSFITTVHGLYSVKRYSSIMARGDKVIAVSNTSKQYVLDHYKKYLHSQPELIYRGIDSKQFPYNHKPSADWLTNIQTKFPELTNNKTVLLPGRLTSLKGAKDLLYWLKNCKENHRLLLTSDKSSNEYSRKLNEFFIQNNVESKVIWIGLQSKMAELYAFVDMTVSTSKRPESFGRTVLEALAIGTPVVAYAHGGVEEILDSLFPEGKVMMGDPIALAHKINQMLEIAPKVPNKNPFELSTMLNKTLSVYKSAVQHG